MVKKYSTHFLAVGSILVLFLFAGCSKKGKDPDPEVPSFNGKLYTIAAGSNSSNTLEPPINTNFLKFRAKFDSSAIYTTVDPLNQNDTNKLFGLSDCFTRHQQNSARFGWRWVNNHLEIMAYCHIGGNVPEPVVVDTVALNTVNSYSIAFNETSYVFTVNDTSSVTITKNCNNSYRYKLYPYFGGDETAPHEIRIWVEEN